MAAVTDDSYDIGDTASAATTVAFDKIGVDSIISEFKHYRNAKKSGIEIKLGNPRNVVANANRPKMKYKK
ncbi:hypothetical protein [Borrelia persica]|uniref:hypothetical protein n=1 Tax=Borrelia persica TaxID=44448 RepID=UPI0004650218|nr:hypothetical protein [Borrelia persica]